MASWKNVVPSIPSAPVCMLPDFTKKIHVFCVYFLVVLKQPVVHGGHSSKDHNCEELSCF